MFGKIKGKLSGIFSKSSDEVFEEDEAIKTKEEKVEQIKEEPKKKGFFSKVFGGKSDEKEEEIEEEPIEKEIEKPSKSKEKVEKEVKKTTPKSEPKQQAKTPKKVQKEESKKEEVIEQVEDEIIEPVIEEKEEEPEKKEGGFFSKAFGKLTKKKLNVEDFDKIWMDLEIFLLEINIAYEIVEKIESNLRENLIDESFDRFSLAKKIREIMVEEVSNVLVKREDDLLKQIKDIRKSGEVARILVLGVNGTGKTTSIAKFVHFLKKNNLSVVVAAADTFRAAAVEQLDEHAQRVGFKLIKHKGGSDPAAVAFDAIEHAKAKNVDVVLIDTAGRMPNNSNLMQELAKIERVSKSQINLFIGDSVSGNDLLDQIELFDKVVGISGLILTKTDTDEKPGSIVSAAYKIEKPIYYLGIGQGYDDLVKFEGKVVAEKLFEI